MSSMEKTLSSWRKLILSNNFELPYEQLKSDASKKKWTSDQEAFIATYCLVAVNMKAHEAFKSTSQDCHAIQQMFKLTELCCNLIEKTWKCNGTNFLGSIYNICRYFLSQNYVYETLVVSQYGMEYVEKRRMNELCEEELRSIKALLFLHLKYLNATEFNESSSEIIFNMWKFIFSSQAVDLKDSNATVILETFQYFCSKAVSLADHSESSLVLFLYLKNIRFTNLTDSNLCSFIAICRILINCSSSSVTKTFVSTIINCIDDFGVSKTHSQYLICKFCCDILRFSVCGVDSSTNSSLVDRCVEQLHSISSLPQLLINHVLYFASMVLLNLRHRWVDGDSFFYKNCIISVFRFLIALANHLEIVDLNQVSGVKNKNTQDHFHSVYLANLVLSLTYRIQDLDAMLLKILYPHVFEATRISLKLYDEKYELEAKKRSQLYYLIGASCVNISRTYMKAELYSESQQLSMMAAQNIASLSSSQISNSSLQPCAEKLVICLYNSFKNLNLYEDALRTTCIWAIKLPSSEKVFMELFASLKAKMLSNEKKDHLNTTSWDLLIKDKKKSQSIWSNISLINLQIFPLLKSELRQYAVYSVKSPSLIEKIINIAKEQDDIFVKMEFYVWGGITLTLSNDCLMSANKLLSPVETFIEELEKKNKLKIAKEKSLLYSYLLGNLFYTKFRIKLLHARCESEQEVILTNKIKAPSSTLEQGMEQETRDASDIINKYLTYESQQEIVSFLDLAVKHWSDVKTKMQDIECSQNCFDITSEKLSLLMFIREAAFLYRLYCHELKELNAWKLLLSLAVICNDSDTAVFAFSNLSSISVDSDLTWETEAEKELATATESVQIRYQLETATKLLKSGNASKGVALLSKISENDLKKHEILWAKYHFITSQYEWAGYIEPIYNPALMAFKAYCKLVSWIKNSSWRTFWESCEAQSLLFDVTLFIGNLYCGSYQITEAKCYLKEHVNLIQKLCLPLRISQFLIALCQVSFITCNVEDCYAKLSALKSVLKLGDKNSNKDYIDQACSKASVAVSPVLAVNSDVRFVSNFSSNDFFSSPVLESGLKFDIPKFVYHESDCLCAVCEDVQYQLISCEVMCLFGPYFYRAGKSGKALHHFKNALEMLHILQDRLKSVNQSKDMAFLKLKIVTKLRQADFWASCRDFEKAEVSHKEATADSLHLIVPDHAILREIKDQYWALKGIKANAPIREEALPKRKQTRSKVPLPTTSAKTPANKMSTVIFEDDEDSKEIALIKNMSITPHPKNSRRLLFKKDDPSFVTPIKPLPITTRSSRFNKKQDNTPPDIVMQTPSSISRAKRVVKKNVAENASVEPSTRLRSRRK